MKYLHNSVVCIVMLKVVADIWGKAVVVEASFVKDELTRGHSINAPEESCYDVTAVVK